jgi:membrane protein
VITFLFAAIFKVLPDVHIAWRDVWLGAAMTALLFSAGKYLLGLYLANAGSVYGAAGSLVVFLLWVYYSAQILFMGAEFTQVYARGSGIRAGSTVISAGKDSLAGDKENSRESELAARRQTTTP